MPGRRHRRDFTGGAGNVPFLDLDAGCGWAHFGEIMSCTSMIYILVSMHAVLE